MAGDGRGERGWDGVDSVFQGGLWCIYLLAHLHLIAGGVCIVVVPGK